MWWTKFRTPGPIAACFRKRWRVLVLAVFAGVPLAGWLALELAVTFATLPAALESSRDVRPVTLLKDDGSRTVTDRDGEVLLVLSGDGAREAVPLGLSEMSPWLVQATIDLEDRRFYRHGGVDWLATARAGWRNLRAGRVVSGASTISQQLVKISSGPGRSRGARAKLHEALAAMKLERSWSKEDILEAYLNSVDYGNRRIGPEAASRAYFGKSADRLSMEEAVFLVGLPQSPTWLNPWRRPAEAAARYVRNATRLHAAGWDEDGDGDWMNRPPEVSRIVPPAQAVHFGRMAAARHPDQPVVRTSLDGHLQSDIEYFARRHLQTLMPFGAGNVAVVILDNASGEVRAMVSESSPEEAGFNSTVMPRSPGSAIKPFLYLAALEDRALTAATLLPDTEEAIAAIYRDYDPRNYSRRYHGPVRVRQALASSLNVPAVVATSRVGAREAFLRLQEWGLRFPGGFDQYGAGFILGNAPVSVLDLAGTYASMARGGYAWDPLLTPEDLREPRIMASPEACAILSDILADNQARALAFGLNSPLHTSRRTAVKTGTSSGFRDAWCVGFNGTHTVAVWVGNLSGEPMDEMLAAHSAAPLWNAIMEMLFQRGDAPLPTYKPAGNLVRADIDRVTGLLLDPEKGGVNEWFLSGTGPVEEASTMRSPTGQLLLPVEYAAWCRGPHNHLNAAVVADRLEILFPAPDTRFVLDPYLSPKQQQFLASSTEDEVEWFLNDEPLASHMIPLRTGEWTLTARHGGEQAEVRFQVE